MSHDDMKLIIEAAMWLGGISLICSTIIVFSCMAIKGMCKWTLSQVARIRQVR